MSTRSILHGKSGLKIGQGKSNLLIVGALEPELFESMTMVPGTHRDSMEGEEGKANDLNTIHGQG